jgi:hypothetical protein
MVKAAEELVQSLELKLRQLSEDGLDDSGLRPGVAFSASNGWTRCTSPDIGYPNWSTRREEKTSALDPVPIRRSGRGRRPVLKPTYCW